MISDFWITIISILISFLLGIGVMLWFTRGWLGVFMKARRGAVMVRVHNPDGLTASWKAASLEASGMLAYKDGKEKRVISPVSGSIIRCSRVYMLDAPLGDTAPFVWKKVISVEEEGKGKVYLFEHYKDNNVIAQALDWALIRPKRNIPGLGIDLVTLLIILGIIGVVVFFIMKGQAGGAGVI